MKKLFTLLAVFSFALLTACSENATETAGGATDDFEKGSTSVKGLSSPDAVSIVDAKDE